MHDLADQLRALLAEAQAALPAQRAHFDALLARVREGKHDARRVHDAGLALEEIARTRLYRIARYPSLPAMLAAEIGISRTTAHRWRAIARGIDPARAVELGTRAAYDEVRRGAPEKPRIGPRDRERVALAVRALRKRGIPDARVEVVRRGGRKLLRIDVPIADADRLW